MKMSAKTLKGVVIGVVLGALIAGGTAGALVAGFVDVDETKFYADPVEWAKDNAITTGSPAGSDTFKPDDPVTRGENVTFAYRYDQNVVQPKFTEIDDAMPEVHWIWIGTDGAKRGGTDGVTSSKTGTGSYTVDFDGTDITGCSWSAVGRLGPGLVVLGTSDIMISLQQGFTGFLPSITVPDQIYVNAFDDGGSTQDANVQLQVIC